MSLIQTITRTMLVKPHPAGYPFIGGALALSILFLLIWEPLGVAMLILAGFIAYFFRDPVRSVPQKDGFVISPADGRVISITPNTTLPDGLDDEVDLGATFTKISIFLSVLDVHVNRAPISGTVIKKFYHAGKFLNAELDKASAENERSVALIKTPSDQYIGVSQIAGLVARRIITDLEEGKDVTAGERFGIIRFGSRADIYLPKDISPLVCISQRTIGGETILADLSAQQQLPLTAKDI
jgi:phosphatidylserine decarboxylase